MSTPHLNSTGCTIRHTEKKGRGVFADRHIPSQTLIEISPVLFFSKDEYDAHGKFTALDDYTFKWGDGRMALALGLGSLFNHSEKPNVLYTLDTSTDSIRYTTTRDIALGEELCIFYGHKLWFVSSEASNMDNQSEELEDVWGGLLAVVDSADPTGPYLDGDPQAFIEDEDLPFTRYKLPPEEEDMESIRTVDAWVVDIPDPRHITIMLKWLKSAGLETPDLGHLKRIRKQQPSLETTTPTTTLLLVTTLTAPSPPTPPPELGLPPPYVVRVPSTPALTPPVLKLKCTLWPTLFTPPRKGEAEPWTRGRARWAWEAMQAAVEAAKQANKTGELPIAAYIAAPYDDDEGGTKQKELTFVAHDTRVSSAHPLRHAVINVVRQMADYRARSSSLASTPTPSDATEDEVGRNGTNYLLTSLTVFTTHEPCIMCSMALIHSRVKEVVFLHPMPRTGGCGGAACLPTLKGINHRFGIGEWKRGHCEGLGLMPKQEELYVDETIDA